jgi:acyl-CoA synthetase (AMP-forming)/AMP-acid ligase II
MSGMSHLDPGIETIPAVLRNAAEEFGDLEAVVDGASRVTFAELADLTHDAALALIASGIEPGDRVSIWAQNCLEWIVASFAVYSVGAVLVPINTRFKGNEAGHVLHTAGSRLLLASTDAAGTDLVALLDDADPQLLASVEEVVVLAGPERQGHESWPEFVSRSKTADPRELTRRSESIHGDDPSDIIFTSGTTGKPKGAVLTHSASVRTYMEWSELVGLRRGDRYLIVYPFFHTAGLKSGVLACALRGSTMIPQAVFDVETIMDKVATERISMLPGPPTVFQSILDHPGFTTFDLSSLRLSVTGAATVPVEVVRRMREELRFETVVTGYGLTETTGTVSMCRHDDPPETIATTVGRPLAGVELRIVDDSGVDVPKGSTGEILVRGFNVMKEYFCDPEATASAIDKEGWFRTGDVGLLEAEGNLRITDRKKDMFIVGGFNAYPAEIEGIMLAHAAISQVAVIGIPDERLGEVGKAFVVTRPGARHDESEIVEWCRDHMANYKVPRSVAFAESLPLTPSGKVMKYMLRDQV